MAFSLLEEILGIPLYVPNTYDYFSIEDAGMPNGDPCLVVHGDVSNTFKAVLKAPTMSPVDVCNVGDITGAHDWAMSCWMKIPKLASASHGAVILGCSGYGASAVTTHNRNTGWPVFLGAGSATSTIVWFRDVLNNVSSPDISKALYCDPSGAYLFDHWILFVVNVDVAASITAEIYLDTFETPLATDTASGSAASGSYAADRMLHIGAWHSGGVGYPAEFRLGKWAFHDHQLDAAERRAMWEAMMGDAVDNPKVHTDDFDRAALGDMWGGHTTLTNPLVHSSNQLVATGTTGRYGLYTQDLGSDDMYAQADVSSLGGRTQVIVRGPSYGAGSTYGYHGGWVNSAGRWEINRSGGVLANSASSPPSSSHTVRLEARTVGGDVELKLYDGNTLVLSTTDSSGASEIHDTHLGGIYMAGRTSPSSLDAIMDNFECGTL